MIYFIMILLFLVINAHFWIDKIVIELFALWVIGILFVWKVVLISQTLNVHILALTIVSIENIILINRVWTFNLLNISLFLIFKNGLIVFLIYQLGLAFVSPLELVIGLIFFNSVNMVNQMISNDRLEDILVGKTQCQILLVLIIL